MADAPATLARLINRSALALALVLPNVLATVFWVYWQTPQMAGESPCYISWCPKLTSVYPGVVSSVPPAALLPLQLFAFSISASWLGWTIYKMSSSSVLAAVTVIGIVANPYLWLLQGSIMSEALTSPAFLLLAGLTLAYLTNSSRSVLVAVSGLLAGVIAAARPSDVPIVLVPLSAVLLAPGRRWWERASSLALVCICWGAPIIIDKLYTRAALGSAQTSLIGRHAFGKAAVISSTPLDRQTLSPLERRVADVVEEDYAPIRKAISEAPAGAVRDVVRFNYEVCVQFACTDLAMASLRVPRPELDRALFSVGIRRLRQSAGQYLHLAVGEYRGLWLLHPRKHPDIAPRYNTYVSGRNLPFRDQLGEEGQTVDLSEQRPLYRVNRAIFVAFGVAVHLVLMWLGIKFLRKSLDPYSGAALACLIGAFATLAFISLVGVGIPRYTIGLWPLLLFGLSPAVKRVLALVSGRIRSGRPSGAFAW